MGDKMNQGGGKSQDDICFEKPPCFEAEFQEASAQSQGVSGAPKKLRSRFGSAGFELAVNLKPKVALSLQRRPFS